MDNKTNGETLAFRIVEEVYNMVVMCSNRPRLNHFEKLINYLENSRNFNKKINIWIDEADSNINLWSSYSHIIFKEIVDTVTLVSATFDSVFKKYSRLNIIGSSNTYPDCYRCLKDSNKIIVDFICSKTEDYIVHIIEKYPDLIKNGMKGFIPGGYYKSSHDKIADILVNKYNFVVLIINGERKEFLIPGKESIDISEYLTSSAELKDILSRIYYENKFYEYPFAITGLECVKRGITFQSNNFLFDYGIIPFVSKKVEAYQLMARLFGNIGDFCNYKPCSIYSPSSNFNKIQKQESMAINIAKIVEEQSLGDVGNEELRQAMVLGDLDLLHEVFDTQELAISFSNGPPLNQRFQKRSGIAPRALLNDGDESSLEKNNPSITYLLSRKWGLSNLIPVRMVPTKENNWCVYWKPSLL
jgi:hypothetical protein